MRDGQILPGAFPDGRGREPVAAVTPGRAHLQTERGPCIIVLSATGDHVSYPLDNDVTTVGRRSDRDIVLAEPQVSGSHAEIVRVSGGFAVRDCFSKNGTTVNGKNVVERKLEPGDRIELGGVPIFFSDRNF
ncbi:MAG TPA: FHA domain-containing protein, partial [Planctomycetota bacterium]|nr:FHA domain-containing protein [Planctomycetota bacterium]